MGSQDRVSQTVLGKGGMKGADRQVAKSYGVKVKSTLVDRERAITILQTKLQDEVR